MSTEKHIIPVETQNQLSQLQLIFRGPLVKDSIVNLLNDLTLLDSRYNYEHKIVWVKEAKSNYFLTEGDGTVLTNWSKVSTSAQIEPYDNNELYQVGDIVLYLNKLYIANGSVPINSNPTDNKNLWISISADTVTYRYIFDSVSSMIFYTEIANPIFEIGLCTFEKDNADNYVIDTDGLIKTVNYKVIDASVERRNDIPNNNGRAYEVSFIEDSLPVNLTGVINIR